MLKKGLGKGLGALISEANGENEASAVLQVALEHIKPNPYQPRKEFDPVKLTELAQSIEEHGVLQPVLLRRMGVDQYELIAGERRFRASQLAKLNFIPAILKEYANPQMLEIALIENVQREDINPVDAAMAYHQLATEFGMTQEQIAKRVGKARATIANTLRLLGLDLPILNCLREGRLSEGHARALLQAPKDRQVEAFEIAQKKLLTVRETERLAREMADHEFVRSGLGDPRSPKNSALEDPHLMAVEEALRVSLKTKVKIRNNNGIGRIEIDFYSGAELDGLIERLLGPDGAF